jgi:hypothetical protein
VKPPTKSTNKNANKPTAKNKEAPIPEDMDVEVPMEIKTELEVEDPKPAEEEKSEDTTVRGKSKKRSHEAEKPAAKKQAVEKPVVESTTNEKEVEVLEVPVTVLDEVRPRKEDLLNIEYQLCVNNNEIMKSLCLEKADPKKCLEHMDQLKLIIPKVTALMLKKNPQCVKTIKRLRNYVGNCDDWNQTTEELAEFQKQSAEIQKSAKEIYEIFKQQFESTGGTFADAFVQIVAEFKKRCELMSDHDVAALCFEEELS